MQLSARRPVQLVKPSPYLGSPCIRSIPLTAGWRKRCSTREQRRDSSGLIAFTSTGPIFVTPEQKEDQAKSRRFRRDIFDHQRWIDHRSNQRYMKNIISIPNSRIVRSLSGPLTWVAWVSTAICVYEALHDNQLLPTWLPRVALSNPQPQVLTSFALSLLLVFRTNSSYARWDEARKMWGGVLNHSRNIVQQTCAFFPVEDEASREAMARWTICYSLALQAHLQDDVNVRTSLSRVLEPEELDMIMASDHKVVKTLQVMGELVQQAPLSLWQADAVQANITFFYDALGGCERILRTPIPLSYTRHTCRFLLIWLTFLPFGLLHVCNWMTIPVTVFIGLLLLGIDEIGVQIEEPFGILALEAICSRVESDTKQLLNDRPSVRSYVISLKERQAIHLSEQLMTSSGEEQLTGWDGWDEPIRLTEEHPVRVQEAAMSSSMNGNGHI